MAEIYSLVYKPEDENSPEHYTRLPLDSARLLVGQGIEGDLNGSGNPNRQLNVMSFETQQQLGAEGFKAKTGELGEQITLRGLDIDALEAGTRIQLGDQAVIEVIKPRTGCDRFEAIQGHLRSEAANRLGMMAKVVADGVVNVGDPVKVLESVSAK
ncbi:MAG: MOSC domain-containing protein [Chloroflexi bacterium]|nr:MOSC domain-containing protein [Chloroflexota bacterium]